MESIIITGGCGFVGHHFVEHFLKATDYNIIIFDKLTYASNGYDRVRDINAYDDRRVQFFSLDMSLGVPPGVVKETRHAKYILHLAAESHVDNSIIDPVPFVMSNVLGTTHMLEFARKCDNLQTFLYFGTDEVFGPASQTRHNPKGRYHRENYFEYAEWDRYASANPYAASKAGGEEMVLAYHNTHKVPAIITHTMNCFGERQHPEKYIPKIIKAGLTAEEVTVHANPDLTQAGSRFYIHCRNVAAIADKLIHEAPKGEKYNIVGEREVDNAMLVDMIADVIGFDIRKKFVNFHESRPGHDLRYALDGSKVQNDFAIKVPMPFEESLEKTVSWYLANQHWLWEEIK